MQQSVRADRRREPVRREVSGPDQQSCIRLRHRGMLSAFEAAGLDFNDPAPSERFVRWRLT